MEETVDPSYSTMTGSLLELVSLLVRATARSIATPCVFTLDPLCRTDTQLFHLSLQFSTRWSTSSSQSQSSPASQEA